MQTVTRFNVVALLCILALIMSLVAIVTSGPQGLQGEPGPAGVQGVAGVPGITGATGTVGTPGLQGPVGGQGLIGPQGAKGDKGDLSDKVIEVTHLANLMVTDNIVRPDQRIYVCGAAVFWDVEIWLFYLGVADGVKVWKWEYLGKASYVAGRNNSFEKRVRIPSDAQDGVAELSIRVAGSGGTYHVIPILVDD